MHTSTMTHLFVDVSVSVDVVEVEGPLELLSDGAPQQDWQRCHKVLGDKEDGSEIGDLLWKTKPEF